MFDVIVQNRALTICPAETVNLSCIIYKDGVAIASMDPQTHTYELKEYEAGGCYNIYCENDDMLAEAKPFVKFTGNFIFQDGMTATVHDALQRPFWLAGSGGIGDCIDLARSCQELSVTIEAWRKPSPKAKLDPVLLTRHMCASKFLTCHAPLAVPRPAKCETRSC